MVENELVESLSGGMKIWVLTPWRVSWCWCLILHETGGDRHHPDDHPPVIQLAHDFFIFFRFAMIGFMLPHHDGCHASSGHVMPVHKATFAPVFCHFTPFSRTNTPTSKIRERYTKYKHKIIKGGKDTKYTWVDSEMRYFSKLSNSHTLEPLLVLKQVS